MGENKQTFISIEKGKIHTGFHVFNKKAENGMYSWYIPGYNIRFSSETKEQGEKRAVTMVKAFFTYWKKSSNREFILEIHRLGFKASEHHELTVSRLISKKITSAKFKSTVMRLPNPEGYERSKVLEADLELAEA